MGELMEGAMQQAAQWSRQFMVGRIVDLEQTSRDH
jgi:hypothetical protein